MWKERASNFMIVNSGQFTHYVIRLNKMKERLLFITICHGQKINRCTGKTHTL